MKLHLDSNIIEGTPEELVEYLRLVKGKEKTPSTDIQVGDRVKVLEGEGGAVGEATVTAILEDGVVALEGKSSNGRYLTDWGNYVSNLEKIEEAFKESRDYVEKVKAKEDAPMGYTFWYLDTANFNKFVVLEASPEGYFEDSTGKRYTYQAVSGYVKPVDNEYACKAFERARDKRALLSYYPVVDEFKTSY